MLIGSVIRHQFDNHTNATVMSVRKERLEIFQSSVVRMNRPVVGDVVTVVPQGGGKKRHQPDCIDAKFLHVVQSLSETLEIADSVAIAIIKSAYVDLIDDRVFVPTCFALQWQPRSFRTIVSPLRAYVNRIAMPAAIRLVRAKSTIPVEFAQKSEMLYGA